MGVLSLSDFGVQIALGTGNRGDLTADQVVTTLNLAQSRIARSYDFYEMGEVAFAQMPFSSNPAYDKYMIPPPLTKTIHSFVLLDTSSAGSIPSGGGDVISGGPGGPISGGPGGPISGGGSNVIPLPSNAVIGSLGQSRKVVEKPWRWFDNRFPAPEWIPAGWPQIYKRFGNIITMVPPPFMQFTVQLSYTRYPQPFTSDLPDQVSDFENKDDVLIAFSLAYLWKILGRSDRAGYFEGLAKEQLDEAIERDDNRPDIEVSRDVPAIATSSQGAYWANPWVKMNP